MPYLEPVRTLLFAQRMVRRAVVSVTEFWKPTFRLTVDRPTVGKWGLSVAVAAKRPSLR